MNVLTVNVGQGSLAIVRHNKEAIIIDSRIPPANDDTVTFVKGMFSVALKNHNVKGLILTGFDADHADTTGVAIVLKKYRPDWVMYPKYYKDTDEAKAVFTLIAEQVDERAKTTTPLKRHSVRLDRLESRKLTSLGLSNNFDFELFSPHVEDMDSSNNCSIVVKMTGRGPGGFSYLVTGDTEVERWENIGRLFGANLKAHVMAAPHHGSRNGIHPESLIHVAPHTVLISAGVNNPYGHPHPKAVEVYNKVAKRVHATNVQGGVSLLTQAGAQELETTVIASA